MAYVAPTYQNILRFDISVDYSLIIVEILKSCKNLFDNLSSHMLPHFSEFPDERLEVAAIAVFQEYIVVLLCSVLAVHLQKVRVVCFLKNHNFVQNIV
jgi:hypothetical protein